MRHSELNYYYQVKTKALKIRPRELNTCHWKIRPTTMKKICPQRLGTVP